jgi:acyl transferase domain-containing protein
MHGHHIAVLFPGQGVLDTAAFQTYQSSCPEMASMLVEADDVARRFWRTPLAMPPARRRHAGGGLDLLIFVASVAGYNRLQRSGVQPHVLVGHGFGEIAALVAAGALSLGDGLEMAARRYAALASRKARSAMAALKISPGKARTFLRILADTRVSIAVENSSTESVIVGPASGIAAAERLARLFGIPIQRLKITCGPHQASMDGIKEELSKALAHVVPRPLRTLVYSPLLGRLYRDDDDYTALLAEQLAQPLRFADAVTQLVAGGVTLFVECGPLRGLAAELDCAALTDLDFPGVMLKAVSDSRTVASSELEVA